MLVKYLTCLKMQLLSSIYIINIVLIIRSYGDIYLHNPRGSNNRLNELNAQRVNPNRLFDSQNNNRGGYNKGDKTQRPAGVNFDNQYNMKYFQSSERGDSHLLLEWTNQHGFGADNQRLNSNIVIQYLCQEATEGDLKARLRDGVLPFIQPYHAGRRILDKKKFFKLFRKHAVNHLGGLHESYETYDRCFKRQRNKGLFTADKTNLADHAVKTRQNPAGQRYGFECPEERDYYPYWHPNPWKDIAVLTSDTSLCSMYEQESFNVKPRHECVLGGNVQAPIFNTKEDCEKHKGTWTLFYNYLEILPFSKAQCEGTAERQYFSDKGFQILWANVYDHDDRKEACIVLLEKPECIKGDFSRSNHLGNANSSNKMMNYGWRLPFFPTERDYKCVLRLRYNISTMDYDPWNTDASSSNNQVTIPLIKNDPQMNIGVDSMKLQLAINTAQFGRTFQDRSHVFKLRSRSSLSDAIKSKVIHNLNVRGKRGNIVQVYPAVEYDFSPKDLQMSEDELVHIQWTGSNTHFNLKDGADGEGRLGSDRNNMVPLENLGFNFPLQMDTEYGNLFEKCEHVWLPEKIDHNLNKRDLAIYFASSGYYECENSVTCQQSAQSKAGFSPTLDTSPASFEGAILKCPAGTYHVICTRNNNFSNRSQKGTLIVTTS